MIGRRLATAAVAVVAIGAGLAVSTAPAANAQTDKVELACGFDTDLLSINAYYTHCDPSTYVVIKIWGTPLAPSEMCVGPGETWLGSTINYRWAEYAGRLC